MKLKRKVLIGLAALALAGGAYLAKQGVVGKNRATSGVVETLRRNLIKHEGYEAKVYIDTKGHPTIGIGFNLDREDAPGLLERVGADYDAVKEGKQRLNEEQIAYLFEHDMSNAVNSAKIIIKNYDEQPVEVQYIVSNMIYNMGANKFKGFKKTIAAIEAKNYEEAADEMKDSLWYKQVGQRSRYLTDMMGSLFESDR